MSREVITIGDRVKRLRKTRGLTQIELASKAGIDKETVGNIENGKNARLNTLQAIAEALEVNFQYLASGSKVLVDDIGTVHFGYEPDAETIDVDVANYLKLDIPVIGEGDASPQGLFWDDEGRAVVNADEWMSRPNDLAVRDPSCYAIVVRGDSMEPMIRRGHRLIISPNIPVGDGDVAYVHLVSGERLVKAVRKYLTGWLLESYNRDYAPRFVSTEEVTAIHRVAYIRTLK